MYIINNYYHFYVQFIHFMLSRFNAGSGPIWLDDLQCRATDTKLISCGHRPVGSHNCGHHEDVAVFCNGECMVHIFD